MKGLKVYYSCTLPGENNWQDGEVDRDLRNWKVRGWKTVENSDSYDEYIV